MRSNTVRIFFRTRARYRRQIDGNDSLLCPHYLAGASVVRGELLPAPDGIYDILIRDADGRHLELESFEDLESARRRFPAIAAQYPGTRVTLWHRHTRAIVEETEGY